MSFIVRVPRCSTNTETDPFRPDRLAAIGGGGGGGDERMPVAAGGADGRGPSGAVVFGSLMVATPRAVIVVSVPVDGGGDAGETMPGCRGAAVVTVDRSIHPAAAGTGAGGGGGGGAAMRSNPAAVLCSIARAVTWFVRSRRNEKSGATASALPGSSVLPPGTPRE